jgi:hypothetical protein
MSIIDIGDTACLISDSIRYFNNLTRRRELAHIISETKRSNNDTNTSSQTNNEAEREEYTRLEEQKGSLKLSVAIAVFELGVSLHYGGVIKRVTGKELTDGPVGLMGVVSSSLILYEGFLNAKRDIAKGKL